MHDINNLSCPARHHYGGTCICDQQRLYDNTAALEQHTEALRQAEIRESDRSSDDDVFNACLEFISPYEDVIDGNDGRPEGNSAMHLARRLRCRLGL
jgi:hypothetical protein